MPRIDWSSQGRARVYFWTALGTLGCIGIAMLVDYPNLMELHGWRLTRALLQNTLVPVVLAAPALFLLTNKIRQLAIAQNQLTVLASTDSLTAVLNRGAFTLLVDAYLKQARTRNEDLYGALLVVDADHFKDINDAYGHDSGDIALKTIAQSIKGALRGADIVGRIGGEEFGVFLPGADTKEAETVAERVRAAVGSAEFSPNGVPHRLTVSVGGATFHRAIGYSDLYRTADQRLYIAKEAGRDRISLGSADLPIAA